MLRKAALVTYYAHAISVDLLARGWKRWINDSYILVQFQAVRWKRTVFEEETAWHNEMNKYELRPSTTMPQVGDLGVAVDLEKNDKTSKFFSRHWM